MYVDLDFETLSACDLKLCGAERYSEDLTTEVICLSYGMDGWARKERWFPGDDRRHLEALIEGDNIFVAHNAGFEQAIWRNQMIVKHGFPELPIKRWEDTMATCAWKSFPLGLDKGARALGIIEEKDAVGSRFTIGLSTVYRKTGQRPLIGPYELARIADYCDQDVAVETAMRRRIGLLSEQNHHERRIWMLDQAINQRGVKLDLDFVRSAKLVVDRATVPLLVEFQDLTGGIKPGQVQKVIAWAAGQGVTLDNLQKGYLSKLLSVEEETTDVTAGYESNAGAADNSECIRDDVSLSARVRRVLEVRAMLGSASIKKLDRMLACVCGDGRARGLLQYHAAHPGRWGGRLLQPQNFPRGSLKCSPDAAVDAIDTGDPEYVEMVLGLPAIEAVASSLRHALVAEEGNEFAVGDFAGIEARVVLALAGQHDKCALMASGVDVYLDFAEVLNRKPTGWYTEQAGGDRKLAAKMFPKERQGGKGGVLGCGFQCGGPNLNIKFLDGEDLPLAIQAVDTYRQDWAPKVPALWYALEAAALKAVQTGRLQEAYGVVFAIEGEFLTAALPSGWQKLWYYKPTLCQGKFGNDAWKYLANKNGKLIWTDAYGGLLTENVVQALARGLLVAAMFRFERLGMPVVLTVHDEIVCELRKGMVDRARFEAIMAEPTRWSDQLRVPISVEGWVGERYRK